MAKNTKSQLFVHGPQPDFGRLKPVGVKTNNSAPVLIRLDDGTELEIRVVVFDVKRSENRHNPDGNPVYAVQAAQVIRAKVPPRLKLVSTPKKKVVPAPKNRKAP